MEIKPHYVTYEIAKWLKVKGFDEKCEAYYLEDGKKQYAQYYDSTPQNSLLDDELFWISGAEDTKVVATCPEHWQLIEWIRVKHGIWVSVLPDIGVDYIYKYKIYSVEVGVERCLVNGQSYEKPEQAYNAAFEYIKENNLI